MNDEREPAREEMTGHGPAHDAQANEADGFDHFFAFRPPFFEALRVVFFAVDREDLLAGVRLGLLVVLAALATLGLADVLGLAVLRRVAAERELAGVRATRDLVVGDLAPRLAALGFARATAAALAFAFAGGLGMPFALVVALAFGRDLGIVSDWDAFGVSAWAFARSSASLSVSWVPSGRFTIHGGSGLLGRPRVTPNNDSDCRRRSRARSSCDSRPATL